MAICFTPDTLACSCASSSHENTCSCASSSQTALAVSLPGLLAGVSQDPSLHIGWRFCGDPACTEARNPDVSRKLSRSATDFSFSENSSKHGTEGANQSSPVLFRKRRRKEKGEEVRPRTACSCAALLLVAKAVLTQFGQAFPAE